ncbi:MAG: hypothetical protein ACK4EX_00455 [Thermaurantimonas sp.]|uniref:hypothetical protein n=1 Tax=Thermaurantimonas sp. TaxID=2681568 RepID=UPI00391DA838
MQRLKELIENFDQIELQDVDLLKQYAHQHPYSSIVQLAYVYFLKKQENYNFNTQLKLTAAAINSRTKLFNIIHGSNIAKVVKYYQAPVYVQEFDKIDDLRNEKKQNLEEANTSKNTLHNSLEPSIVRPETSSDEKFEKNLLNDPNTQDNSQIPTNISERNKEDSASVTHQYNQHFEENEIKSVNTEIPESKEKIESNLKSEEKEKQNISENNLDAIREKIRAKFGQQNSKNNNKSDNKKNISDNLNPVSENSNQFLSPPSLNKEEKKIPPIENTNSKEEKAQSTKKDITKESSLEDVSDNEKLKEVKNRASNILKKLEALKSKYATMESKPNEDKRDSDETDKPLVEQKSVEPTNEENQNTSQNLENEIQVVFDLTVTKIERSTTINDDSSISESAHIVENFNEDNTTVDNTKENQNNVQSKSDNHALIHSIDDTEISNNNSITTSEISFENEKFYSHEVKEEFIETSIVNKSEELNDEEDIFSKWLKTLHRFEENSSKENDLKDRLSPQNSSETNSKNNANKKFEKLKIIDNFLSGNIQIKPKSPSTKAVEEQKDLSIKYTETTPDLMTETLAELYIAQGHVDKAIQALEILKLKNPEKSSYFARRIQELKKKK